MNSKIIITRALALLLVICMAFGMIAGLSGWMVTKDQIMDAIGNNTVTYAKSVGE